MPLLPFLKNKQKMNQTGVIVQQRAPDEGKEEQEDGMDPALHAAAQDILRAISSNDSKHLALAIKAAFEICDAAPHHEGPHLEENE